MTKKEMIICITIIVLCLIVLILGVTFDNRCETFLGILGIISGWIGMATCGYMILSCIFN